MSNELNIESIWQGYSVQLKRFLAGRVSDPADVDDLLQEILIKTHRSVSSLKSSDKLKPWLYQLAANTVADFYRKKGRQRPLDADDLWYGEHNETETDQFSECMLPFVDALPDDTSTLLRAVDIDGRPQKEIAAELGISYSTLKSRVQRGRGRLRSLLEECCHFELDRHGNIVSYQQRPGSCKGC